jgi:hypoxanthine phosphoribosyltransferase
MDIATLNEVLRSAQCVFDECQVEAALDQLAADISAKLANSNPLVLCVMTGGVILTGRLATRLKFPLQMDYIHATRYREALHGQDLQWRVTPVTNLKGRTVLVLDDIFDVGETLSAIRDWCLKQEAASVYTAVLIDKQHSRKTASLKAADFTALHTDDKYLFGYGMDYKGYWRNASGIYAVMD